MKDGCGEQFTDCLGNTHNNPQRREGFGGRPQRPGLGGRPQRPGLGRFRSNKYSADHNNDTISKNGRVKRQTRHRLPLEYCEDGYVTQHLFIKDKIYIKSLNKFGLKVLKPGIK